MNKPHVHAEVIKAWADGAEIEFYDYYANKWFSFSNDESICSWNPNMLYRVKPEVTHKIGNKYNNGTYLLASVGNFQVSLINIKTGKRWSENVTVKSVNSITEEEFASACSYGKFTLSND